jgi:hypothetical protein
VESMFFYINPYQFSVGDSCIFLDVMAELLYCENVPVGCDSECLEGYFLNRMAGLKRR